jgi:hypothetical protein
MLMDSWNHILLHDKLTPAQAKQVLVVVNKFQADLVDLSKQIEDRNAKRAKPFQAFNPTFLECSISV